MSAIFGKIKSKELIPGFSYSIKDEEQSYIYIGRSRFLGESETLSLKVIEEYVFSCSTDEGVIFKEFALKNVGSDGIFSISEEETNSLFQTYSLKHKRMLESSSNEMVVEIAKFLFNPVVAKYTKEKQFKSSIELFEDMQQLLSKFIEEKDAYIYSRGLYPKKSEDFHYDKIIAYIHMLFQLKHHLLSDVDTNQLSKKKLEEILFTKSIQDRIIVWIKKEVSRCNDDKEKEHPFALRFTRDWMTKENASYQEFLEAYNEGKDKTIDFSKSYKENNSNLIGTDDFDGTHYKLHRMKTLFGDMYFLFCDIYYLHNLNYLSEEVFKEKFYKDLF